MDDAAPAARVSVFEAVNESLREFFIGTTTTSGDLPALSGGIAARCIEHWRQEHKISCRIVENGLGIEDALKFVESYARSTARTGWTVLTE